MTCPNCHKPSGLKYCSDKCLAEYSNNVRLAFYPDLTINPELAKLDRRAAQVCLIRDMSIEQLQLFSKLLLEHATDIQLLVYSVLGRDETIRKAKAKADAKHKDLSTKESLDKQQRIETAKSHGDKISPTGKCVNCGVPSTALLCGPICKAEYKAIQHWMKMGMNMQSAAAAVAANAGARTVLHIPPPPCGQNITSPEDMDESQQKVN